MSDTMQTAVFWGSSDDLIEVQGVKGADEFNIINGGPWKGTFNLGGRMRVYAIYDGCWTFAPGKVDEQVEMPTWPIRIFAAPENKYSMRLEIDVPWDVKLFLEKQP